jgi:hypothetical protein
MSKHPFGWDLPAGAETDPRAPWNQKDPPECVSCGDEADRTGCRNHAGPVCAACSCPECPSPNLEEPDGPDPDAVNDAERDRRAMEED